MQNTKLVKLNKRGQIVIPKTLQEGMGIKPGDLLLLSAEANWLLIATQEKYAQTTRGLLKGTWGSTKEQVETYLDTERNSWES